MKKLVILLIFGFVGLCSCSNQIVNNNQPYTKSLIEKDTFITAKCLEKFFVHDSLYLLVNIYNNTNVPIYLSLVNDISFTKNGEPGNYGACLNVSTEDSMFVINIPTNEGFLFPPPPKYKKELIFISINSKANDTIKLHVTNKAFGAKIIQESKRGSLVFYALILAHKKLYDGNKIIIVSQPIAFSESELLD